MHLCGLPHLFTSVKECSPVLLVVHWLKDVASYVLSIFLVVGWGCGRVNLDPVTPSWLETEILRRVYFIDGGHSLDIVFFKSLWV